MPLFRAFLLVAIAVAAPAWAQSLSLSLNGGAGSTVDGGVGVDAGTTTTAVNASRCDDTLTVTWNIAAAGTSCNSGLRIWIDTGTCGSDPDDGVDPLVETSWTGQLTGTTSFKISSLPGISGTDGGTTCGAIEQDYRICGALQYNTGFNGCQSVQATNPPTLSYDALPPAIPATPTLTPLDDALTVNFTAPGDASFMAVQLRRAGTANDFVQLDRVSTSRGSSKVEGLTNGTDYEVRVVAIDAADNQSEASPSVIGQPRTTVGFFSEYKQAGGAETGGCGAMGGGAIAGAGVATLYGLWALSRRRR